MIFVVMSPTPVEQMQERTRQEHQVRCQPKGVRPMLSKEKKTATTANEAPINSQVRDQVIG